MTFDLEMARATYRAGCAEDAANLVPDLIAEIERLRAVLLKCGSYVGIGAGEGDLPISERVRRCVNRLKETQHKYEQNLITKDARIQELEDAHKRSGAKYAKIINELRSSVYANIPGLKKQWDEILNTSANGKIGPDADECPDDLPPIGSPYRSWQITEERIRAIQWAEEMAGDCKAGDVLRAMLTEAEQ